MRKTSRFLTFVIVNFALLAIFWTFMQTEVYAQGTCLNNITVTSSGDSGPGSLRQALVDVCSNGTVDFASGLTDQTITLASSELIITKTVTITNPQAANLRISGNNTHRIFYIKATAVVTINNLSIISGTATAGVDGCLVWAQCGGGIVNIGILTIENSTITDNYSRYYGGGIYTHQGTLTIKNSILSNNLASYGFGGGLSIKSGNVIIHNSFFDANSSFNSCGAIENVSGMLMISDTTISNSSEQGICNNNIMVIDNSTLRDNTARRYGGGGITNSGTMTVTTSIFSNNSSEVSGGAIHIYRGTANISNTIFNGNSAYDGIGGGLHNAGGAIYNNSMLTINRSTFTNNSSDSGSGITNNKTAIINNSTFSNNSATQYGGGISNRGSLTINNSTFSNNSATQYGGGISNRGSLTINNSTFSNNSAAYYGGGIITWNDTTLHLRNSIIANSNHGGDCKEFGGTIVINLNNLIEDGSCNPSLSGTPRLSPLQDNGGSTFTHSLLPGSPAINAGDNATCLTTDQRGIGRPQQGQCDIGAFESRGFTLAIKDGNHQKTTIGSAFSIPLELTVISNAGNEPVNGGVLTFTAPTNGPSTIFAPMVTRSISSGEVLLNVTANITAGGSYDITADTISGNSVDFTLTNTKATPDISITVPVSPSIVEQAVVFTVEVSSTIRMPTGSVTLFVDGTPQLPLSLNQEYASFDIATMLPGTKVITAAYNGDDNFNASVSDEVTHIVKKVDTTTSIIATTPNPSKVGQPVTVTYYVDVHVPGAGSPSSTVVVGDGSVSCEGTVEEGKCALTFTSTGTKVITATYSGDDNFNTSVSSEVTHTVESSGQNITQNKVFIPIILRN